MGVNSAKKVEIARRTVYDKNKLIDNDISIMLHHWMSICVKIEDLIIQNHMRTYQSVLRN